MGWAGWQVGYLDDVSPSSTVMEKSCDHLKILVGNTQNINKSKINLDS